MMQLTWSGLTLPAALAPCARNWRRFVKLSPIVAPKPSWIKSRRAIPAQLRFNWFIRVALHARYVLGRYESGINSEHWASEPITASTTALSACCTLRVTLTRPIRFRHRLCIQLHGNDHRFGREAFPLPVQRFKAKRGMIGIVAPEAIIFFR